MSLALDTWAYALDHLDELRQATLDHLLLVAIALGISIAVCVPLGVWTSRSRGTANVVINSINGLRVIPSLAILFLMVPYLGVGLETAVIALTILAMPPILVNTDAAFRTIDPAIKEAAAGMGMTKNQILLKVEFPLALPVILTGIRTATTEVIASANPCSIYWQWWAWPLRTAWLCHVPPLNFASRRDSSCAAHTFCRNPVKFIRTHDSAPQTRIAPILLTLSNKGA